MTSARRSNLHNGTITLKHELFSSIMIRACSFAYKEQMIRASVRVDVVILWAVVLHAEWSEMKSPARERQGCLNTEPPTPPINRYRGAMHIEPRSAFKELEAMPHRSHNTHNHPCPSLHERRKPTPVRVGGRGSIVNLLMIIHTMCHLTAIHTSHARGLPRGHGFVRNVRVQRS